MTQLMVTSGAIACQVLVPRRAGKCRQIAWPAGIGDENRQHQGQQSQFPQIEWLKKPGINQPGDAHGQRQGNGRDE